jgi:hypothetical protein
VCFHKFFHFHSIQCPCSFYFFLDALAVAIARFDLGFCNAPLLLFAICCTLLRLKLISFLFGATTGLPETVLRSRLRTKYVTRYAMTWSVCTLLLTAVAFIASRASVQARAAVPEHGRSWAVTLTRFVYAKCSETGHIGLGMIGVSKPCSASKLGIQP